MPMSRKDIRLALAREEAERKARKTGITHLVYQPDGKPYYCVVPHDLGRAPRGVIVKIVSPVDVGGTERREYAEAMARLAEAPDIDDDQEQEEQQACPDDRDKDRPASNGPAREPGPTPESDPPEETPEAERPETMPEPGRHYLHRYTYRSQPTRVMVRKVCADGTYIIVNAKTKKETFIPPETARRLEPIPEELAPEEAPEADQEQEEKETAGEWIARCNKEADEQARRNAEREASINPEEREARRKGLEWRTDPKKEEAERKRKREEKEARERTRYLLYWPRDSGAHVYVAGTDYSMLDSTTSREKAHRWRTRKEAEAFKSSLYLREPGMKGLKLEKATY